MRMISKNPEIIPCNATFKAVGFDSNCFFLNDTRHLKAICGNLGDNGCVQGTGPTRKRNFTDELLKCSNFSNSQRVFGQLVCESKQQMENDCNPNQGSFEPLHQTDSEAAPSQPTGCLTTLCRKLCIFSSLCDPLLLQCSFAGPRPGVWAIMRYRIVEKERGRHIERERDRERERERAIETDRQTDIQTDSNTSQF